MTLTSLRTAVIAGAFVALPALTAVPAMAQMGPADVYLNLGYSRIDSGSADVGALQGRLGMGFGRYFAVEGEAAVGVEDDNGAELDHSLGLFAVGKLPISSQFDIFARAGVQKIETSPGGEDDGAAYGVGANWYFTDKDGIRADWTKSDFGGEPDTWSISYVRKF